MVTDLKNALSPLVLGHFQCILFLYPTYKNALFHPYYKVLWSIHSQLDWWLIAKYTVSIELQSTQNTNTTICNRALNLQFRENYKYIVRDPSWLVNIVIILIQCLQRKVFIDRKRKFFLATSGPKTPRQVDVVEQICTVLLVVGIQVLLGLALVLMLLPV